MTRDLEINKEEFMLDFLNYPPWVGDLPLSSISKQEELSLRPRNTNWYCPSEFKKLVIKKIMRIFSSNPFIYG